MNRPFRETELGGELRRTLPDIFDKVADLVPDRGALGVLKRLLDKEDKLGPLDRAHLDDLIDREMKLAEQVTRRWEADVQSDAPLAKVIRPISLIVSLSLFFLILILDSIDGIQFHVSESFTRLLETITLTICGAYFAGRTLEKSVRR